MTLTFEKIGDKKSVIKIGDKCKYERSHYRKKLLPIPPNPALKKK